jgi:hypothetical protein
LFAHIPGLECAMSKEMEEYAKKLRLPNDELVGLKLNGTTFSGHSFRTTIGNTANSICQQYYYI